MLSLISDRIDVDYLFLHLPRNLSYVTLDPSAGYRRGQDVEVTNQESRRIELEQRRDI